jgi:hypothetical protein
LKLFIAKKMFDPYIISIMFIMKQLLMNKTGNSHFDIGGITVSHHVFVAEN